MKLGIPHILPFALSSITLFAQSPIPTQSASPQKEAMDSHLPTDEAVKELTEKLHFIERKLSILGAATVDELDLQTTPTADSLNRQALIAYHEHSYQKAYFLSKELLVHHPKSEHTVTTCVVASRSLISIYNQFRHTSKTSFWYTAEPESHFAQVCLITPKNTDDRQLIAESTLLGSPLNYWKRFNKFANTYYPQSEWATIQIEEENGRVDKIYFSEPE